MTEEVPKIEDIIQWATRAVQADAKGDLENALEMYTNAANSLERLIEIPGSSESDVEDWKAKAEQYKARVTYLQQKVQEKKIEQYANTARLAQEGMQLAAKGQEAVKSAGGPTPLAGAAAVGAGLGLVLAGPIGALAGAAGIAYAATTRDNTVGNVARKTGQMAVDSFSAIKNFDKEYEISQKAWSASVAGVQKLGEIDRKYHVQEKVTNIAKGTTESITKFEQKNKVVHKVGKGLSDALDWTNQKLGKNEEMANNAADEHEEKGTAFPDVPSI